MERCVWVCVVLATFLCVGAASAAEAPSSEAPAADAAVRFRLYWINAHIGPADTLAPEQSPNVDRAIPGFGLIGTEEWFHAANEKYVHQYVVQLQTTLNAAEEGQYQFRLNTAARTTLQIDGKAVITKEAWHDPNDAQAAVTLTAGPHEVLIVQYVNGESPRLKLDWQPPREANWSEIPMAALSTQHFYFRPTNLGAKKLRPADSRPGKGQKVAGLYPGFDLMTVRPVDTEVPVGGLAMLSDGRLVVAYFDALQLHYPKPQPAPDGQLWLLSNVDKNDRKQITRDVIADGLFEPVGVCVVHDVIYVSERSDVVKFVWDPADKKWGKSIIASGWETNDFHQLSFGLIHEPGPAGHPGFLYIARSTGLGLKKNPPLQGSVWRIDLSKPVGSNVEIYTGGHRTPNGIGWGPDHEIFIADNQGEFKPANELSVVKKGGFYGFYANTNGGGAPTPFQNETDRLVPGVVAPAVLMPEDEISNSPSQPLMVPAGWPFARQMILGDVHYGGINRVSLEKVDGQWQGAVYRLTQGLEVGINRLVFGADGALYAGGIGGKHASTWTWMNPQNQPTYQGLQRLKANGKVVFDLESARATHSGFVLRFTKPADKAYLENPAHYTVQQWTYKSTSAYGGPKIDQETLTVGRAAPAEDGQSVELTIPSLKAGRVVYLMCDAPAQTGESLWSAETWYTLNRIP